MIGRINLARLLFRRKVIHRYILTAPIRYGTVRKYMWMTKKFFSLWMAKRGMEMVFLLPFTYLTITKRTL